MKRVGGRERINEGIQEAEIVALRLVEQCCEGGPFRRAHAGAAVLQSAGTSAVVGLADLDAMERVSVGDHVRYRAHRHERLLIARRREELAHAEAALSGR